MSSVPPLKMCSTFLRFATSDTASATPEGQGPMTNFAPSPATASSTRRVAVPACVAESRTMYLIGRPSTLPLRSSSAIFIPRSRIGPTSENAPVLGQMPNITISLGWARMMAGKPRPAAGPSAPSLRMSRRLSLRMFPPAKAGHYPRAAAKKLRKETRPRAQMMLGSRRSVPHRPQVALEPGEPFLQQQVVRGKVARVEVHVAFVVWRRAQGVEEGQLGGLEREGVIISSIDHQHRLAGVRREVEGIGLR